MPRAYARTFVKGRYGRYGRGKLRRRVTTRSPRRVAARRALRSRFRRRNWRTGGYMGQELKFYDTSLSASTINGVTDSTAGEQNPSATICFNSVVQGDGESNRDGRRITMKSLLVQGHVVVLDQPTETALDNPTHVFIAVVLDTQCNGALLNSEDVFTNPSVNSVLQTLPFRNLQYVDRFKVLAVRKFRLDKPPSAWNGTTMSQSGLIQSFKMFVPLKDLVTTYTGTTETIANIQDNSLNCIAWTSNSDYGGQLYYNARLRFMG